MLPRVGYLLTALSAALAIISSPAASPYPDSIGTSLSLEIQNLVFNDQFSKADSLCEELLRSRPNDPLGHFLKATSLLAQMTDAEEALSPRVFHELLDTIDVVAIRRLESSDENGRAWMNLFLGQSSAYRALYESRFGSIFSAIKAGMKARAYFEEGLNEDSTVYDLYFGLGSYHYWKSDRAGPLKWIGVFHNDKEKGIAEIRTAVDSSLIFGRAARIGLLWVWLNEQMYDSVIVTAEDCRMVFPNGKSFLWPLAEAYFAKREYRAAMRTYELIRRRLMVAPGNYFNVIECDHKICVCFEKLKEDRERARVARRLANYHDLVPQTTLIRQRTKLLYLKRAGGR